MGRGLGDGLRRDSQRGARPGATNADPRGMRRRQHHLRVRGIVPDNDELSRRPSEDVGIGGAGPEFRAQRSHAALERVSAVHQATRVHGGHHVRRQCGGDRRSRRHHHARYERLRPNELERRSQRHSVPNGLRGPHQSLPEFVHPSGRLRRAASACLFERLWRQRARRLGLCAARVPGLRRPSKRQLRGSTSSVSWRGAAAFTTPCRNGRV